MTLDKAYKKHARKVGVEVTTSMQSDHVKIKLELTTTNNQHATGAEFESQSTRETLL